MKYDCSKALDYAHERKRMCNSSNGCDDCKFTEMHCILADDITQKHIDIVQKWSDEHSEKTRKDAYLEIFPKLETLRDKCVCFDDCFPCFDELIGKGGGGCDCDEKTCGECWDEPYNGEFEKAREE